MVDSFMEHDPSKTAFGSTNNILVFTSPFIFAVLRNDNISETVIFPSTVPIISALAQEIEPFRKPF